MTPEGLVKSAVRKILAKGGHYQFWPVPTGYGKRTVDCLACVHGVFFAIETKRPPAPTKRARKNTPKRSLPTVMQAKILHAVRDAGGIAVTINSEYGDPLPELIAMVERNLLGSRK